MSAIARRCFCDRSAVIAAWLVVLVGLVALIITLRNDTIPTAERGGLSFVLLLISTSSMSRSTAGSFPTSWLMAGHRSAAGIRNSYVPCLVRHQEGLSHS